MAKVLLPAAGNCPSVHQGISKHSPEAVMPSVDTHRVQMDTYIPYLVCTCVRDLQKVRGKKCVAKKLCIDFMFLYPDRVPQTLLICLHRI